MLMTPSLSLETRCFDLDGDGETAIYIVESRGFLFSRIYGSFCIFLFFPPLSSFHPFMSRRWKREHFNEYMKNEIESIESLEVEIYAFVKYSIIACNLLY